MKKFVVYGGNNLNIIKQALINRGIWEDVYFIFSIPKKF